MEDLADKADVRRFVRVLLRKIQAQLEDAVLPNGAVRPKDDCAPLQNVVGVW